MLELKVPKTDSKSARGIPGRLAACVSTYRSWPKSDRWALAIVVCVFILVVLFDSFAHKVPTMVTVESDNYFMQADDLLAGKPYTDPYRPPLYVFMTASLSLIFGRNTYLSGSFVSSIAISLIIGLTYILAKEFVRLRYALLAELLVAVNSLVIVHGFLVSTDGLFTALSLLLSQPGRTEWGDRSG